MNKISTDPRIDPRIKAVLGIMPTTVFESVESRQQALEEANTPEAIAQRKLMEAMFAHQDLFLHYYLMRFQIQSIFPYFASRKTLRA